MRRILQLFLINGLIAFNAYCQGPIARDSEKFLGNVYSSSQLPDFEEYWNQVTPENAGKWESVEFSRDSYNFSTLDAAYEFAKSNGFVFRYHVLIWGNQQPSWIEDLPAEEQLEEIEEWMDTIAARYPDMDYLEVVNEPLNDPPNQSGNGGGNYFEALGGTGSTGYDWIINSFKMARERFPNTKLVINEYNILSSTSSTSQYKGVIQRLIDEDLIDAIGVQGHAFSTTGSTVDMKSRLDRLAETGLPIMVTELDIDGPTDQEQLEDYQRIIPVLWEHPSVVGITLWGFKPGMWRTAQQAYLIESDGTERPALTWLRNYIESEGQEDPLNTSKDIFELGVFPNPANKDGFNVVGIPGAADIILLDYMGRQISTQHVPNGGMPIRVDVPASGNYLLKVITVAGNSVTRKVIVK